MRKRRFLGPLALLLAAAFLANQAFACCYANARLARALASVLAPRAPAHACCAKPAAAPVTDPGKPDCARECCLQADSRHAPQLASAPVELPDRTGLPALPAPAPFFAASPRIGGVPISDTGPPVYLRTLRLLV